MVNHKKIQGGLLCLTTALTLAAIADAAPADAPRHAKHAGGSATGVTVVVREEMVSRLIVKPRQGSEKLRRALHAADAGILSRAANAPVKVVRSMSGSAHVIALAQPVRLSEARGIAARMMRDPAVETAEPDRVMRGMTTTPTDPNYAFQWHYFAPDGVGNKGGANLPAAWTLTKGVSAINVAVVDTGYRQHIDLGTVLPGYDFISDAAVARDGNGRDADARDEGTYGTALECDTPANVNSKWHGTHVAGTIAALIDNGAGGAGIAPNVKILPVRVLGKCGAGVTSDIIDAMRWAAGFKVPGAPVNVNPAHVLNLSFGGGSTCAASVQNAVTDIVNAGKVVVVASGNNSSTSVNSPANCAGVIAVTAHTIDGDNADYADIGPEVALSAPGGGCGFLASSCSALVSLNGPGVHSSSNAGTSTPGVDSYDFYQGTSMATPHVAGVAALMLSLKPALVSDEIKSYLQSSVRAHPAGSTCVTTYPGQCGAGLLDAMGALTTVKTAPTVTVASASQVVAPGITVLLSGNAAANTGRSIISYQWTSSGASAGTIADHTTQNASFVAPATGAYFLRLKATDDAGQTGTATVAVRVNSTPVLGAIAVQTATPGSALSFNVTATDADGDAMIFQAASLPSGATLSAAGAFSWPSVGPAGTYTLNYYASDQDASSPTGSVSISVSAPVAAGGAGSFNQEALLGLALLAACLRLRRRLPRPAR